MKVSTQFINHSSSPELANPCDGVLTASTAAECMHRVGAKLDQYHDTFKFDVTFTIMKDTITVLVEAYDSAKRREA